MTYGHPVDCDDLRVILCVEFDVRAPPDAIAETKRALTDAPAVVSWAETAGSFDFLIELAPKDMPTFHQWRKTYLPSLSQVVSRCETSFVCQRCVPGGDERSAIWVRSVDGLKRVDLATVDKISADGDYVHVFVNGLSWMIHATMHSFTEILPAGEFVQLHRSLIVRRNFIQRFSHHGRTWTAHLRDGSSERVARSHSADALENARSSSIMPRSSSSRQSADLVTRRSTND